MIADCFLDTNVLVYAVDRRTAHEGKQAVARELISTADFGLSVQVLQEFYVTVTRRLDRLLDLDQAFDWVAHLSEFPCIELDAGLVTLGIEFSRRFQTSYWDGAIIAAAEVLGASILYTEDLSHGQQYGPVTVVNPFWDLPS